MQLKPLTKGRFHNIWQQDDALIENGLALLRLTDEQDLLIMLEEEVKKYR